MDYLSFDFGAPNNDAAIDASFSTSYPFTGAAATPPLINGISGASEDYKTPSTNGSATPVLQKPIAPITLKKSHAAASVQPSHLTQPSELYKQWVQENDKAVQELKKEEEEACAALKKVAEEQLQKWKAEREKQLKEKKSMKVKEEAPQDTAKTIHSWDTVKSYIDLHKSSGSKDISRMQNILKSLPSDSADEV